MVYESIESLILFSIPALLAMPCGAYMAKVYKNEKSPFDCLQPLERIVFKFCRINPLTEMTWRQYIFTLLVINAVWLVWGGTLLLFQGHLFLNPAGNPSMEWTLAFNSAISFLTSTNLQHYSGESGATYFSQMAVFMFLQFVSAATSLAVGVATVRGLIADSSASIGNFYYDFVRSLTRILLPLSLFTA